MNESGVYFIMGFCRNAALVIMSASLSACSLQHSAVPPTNAPSGNRPAAPSSSTGDYRIGFAKGGSHTFKDVTVARKLSNGDTWISIRGTNFDEQFHGPIVSSITRIDDPNAKPVAPDVLPIRSRAANSRAPASINHPCFDLVACDPWCDPSQQTCPVCEDCESPIGVNPDGTGIGIDTEYGDGFACDFDLSGGGVDCYSNPDGPSPPVIPQNLYISYTLTNIDATLLCNNPPQPGWSTALYGDPKQRGGARKNNIPSAPGTNTWAFPYDFFGLQIGDVYPPSKPSVLRASYYHWGIERTGRLYQMRQGWCNSTGGG